MPNADNRLADGAAFVPALAEAEAEGVTALDRLGAWQAVLSLAVAVVMGFGYGVRNLGCRLLLWVFSL